MITKLRCLLLDDELPGLSYLKMICDQLEELEVVKAFNDPIIFLRDLPNLEFDLCILDIEMPGMNGLELATMLKDKMVIFTTAYNEYAAEAFDLNAVDYVRKPVQRERLHQAVLKARARQQSLPGEKGYIQLNTDKGKSLIHVRQLLYCTVSQTDSRDKLAYLSDGSQLTLKNISFERLAELLPKGQFVRVSKKDLIAVRAIQTFAYNEITTTVSTQTGTPLKLPLSDSYRKEFLRSVQPD
ncbi:response regulator transcription factor [Chryseolinea sp. T2]|uniref:LytR/AlgR family response regulator transcription factor n=1 Tax=Chryseolinea sp. T2 TaxID=3129255 RepID=UPI0030789D27